MMSLFWDVVLVCRGCVIIDCEEVLYCLLIIAISSLP